MGKKVVFCESGYNLFYGAQQSLFNFLINADEEKINISVLSPGEGLFTEKLTKQGIKVDIINYPKYLSSLGIGVRQKGIKNKIKLPFSILKYMVRLFRYFRKEKIDLVCCNDIRSILSCGIAAKLLGIPVLWYVRIDKDLGVFHYIGVKIADHIVLIADNLKKLFKKTYVKETKSKFSTIYTGINLEHIDQIKPTKPLQN